MVVDELWMCERRFWLDSASFYRERVVPDALLVLPQGILDRRAAIEAAREAPRWQDVTFSEQRSRLAARDIAILAYAARAEAGQAQQLYYACCSSTYVRVRDCWMLAAHQQSTAEGAEAQLTAGGALKLFFAGG